MLTLLRNIEKDDHTGPCSLYQGICSLDKLVGTEEEMEMYSACSNHQSCQSNPVSRLLIMLFKPVKAIVIAAVVKTADEVSGTLGIFVAISFSQKTAALLCVTA